MFHQDERLPLHAAHGASEVLLIVHPEAIAASQGLDLRALAALIENWEGPLFTLDDVSDHAAPGSEAEAFLEAVDAAVYDHVHRRRRGRVHADAERGLTPAAIRLVLRLAPRDASLRIITTDADGWGRVVLRLLTAAGRRAAIGAVPALPKENPEGREAA